jgi:hypothetical protein
MTRRMGLLCVILTAACGGASPPVQNAASTGAAASAPTAEPVLTLGAVRLHFVNDVQIGASGELSVSGDLIGFLTPDGALHQHGGVVARLDAEGWIWADGSRTRLRVIDTTLIEMRSEPQGHDEPGFAFVGDQLVMAETHETFTVEGFRPELANEVLFVVGLTVIAMASGMSH